MRGVVSGVTIMEIMAVLAIVGILALASYPTYTRMRTEYKRHEAQAAVVGVESMINRYLVENRKPFFDSDDLDSDTFVAYTEGASEPVFTSNGNYRLWITVDGETHRILATATIDGGLEDCMISENQQHKQCGDAICRTIGLENGNKISLDSDGNQYDANDSTCW